MKSATLLLPRALSRTNRLGPSRDLIILDAACPCRSPDRRMPPDQSRYRNDLGDEELIYEVTEEREKEAPAKWKLRSFLSFLVFDGICSVVLLSPLIAR